MTGKGWLYTVVWDRGFSHVTSFLMSLYLLSACPPKGVGGGGGGGAPTGVQALVAVAGSLQASHVF